ncbi:CDP-glycerol glycerophosphotransferase family protein [Methanogenium sp. MK-MG]|uniref:CDP-glycerol glycerophosphotransferase family protein n=1 Tax=Methanogenium sp. MK-MG TaxID=2599926 RepID=UPI0013EAE58E|nr:CDP-glycerol glycerophosphotransferase family protein [Methanogenium sp. MK-MG]KAF1075767.1 hypothetical protein MKMG_01654 [Methanogenium sp. MK-MG]
MAKILLFYDNFVRDYRGLFFLKKVLEHMGNSCYLEPLFKNAIQSIKRINPDTVVMGQIGEYSTSRIGLFCFENGINLCLNTTEYISKYKDIGVFFRINHENYNDNIIDMQVLGGDIHKGYILDNPDIKNISKYKLTGIPRMDLNIISEFVNAETKDIKERYRIPSDKKIFLYISSFIFDESGGQIDKENLKDYDYEKICLSENRLKKETVTILCRFAHYLETHNGILLIKKHPWDKSRYLEQNISNESVIFVNNCEYISPLIQISDVILHNQSTVAIEAWMQKKNTISINPFFNGDYENLNYHMKHDTIVQNFEELVSCVYSNFDNSNIDKFLKSFNYQMDGKATFRVAQEINNMVPKKTKRKLSLNTREKMCNIISEVIKYKQGLESSKSYANLLYSYEEQKPIVYKMYDPIFDEYISNNL